MAKISIIIPVYNAEKYLRQCLDSIFYQTFQDFECICVNDESTDSSLTILEEYAREDKRFKIISQKNKGVSAARNTGLNNAFSQYNYYFK
jgi:glycosyltransferase involved in cell wall biosynthesis